MTKIDSIDKNCSFKTYSLKIQSAQQGKGKLDGFRICCASVVFHFQGNTVGCSATACCEFSGKIRACSNNFKVIGTTYCPSQVRT